MAADRPKKPMTAFLLYLEEYRPSIVEKLRPEAKVRGMISKTAGEQWRNLAAEIKAPYEQKAAAAKAEYDAALESFKQTGGKVVRKRKADKDAKPKKDKDALKRPGAGGYGVFYSENREKIVKSLPAGSNILTDTAKTAAAQWKGLSGDEKKPYEERYAEKMKEYQVAKEELRKRKADKDAKPKKDKDARGDGARRPRKE